MFNPALTLGCPLIPLITSHTLFVSFQLQQSFVPPGLLLAREDFPTIYFPGSNWHWSSWEFPQQLEVNLVKHC